MAGEPVAGAPAHNDRSAAARGVAVAAARAAAKGVNWEECPQSWGLASPIQCGYVTVPVDYAHPDGRTIKLAVSRARNTGSEDERQGSLVYNPGGPGGSGLDFPTYITGKDPVHAKAAKAYDFVGFDPRGVGRSAPLSCADPQEYARTPKPDPVPDGEADKRAHRKLAAEYADGCKERGGDLLPHMNTPDTARIWTSYAQPSATRSSTISVSPTAPTSGPCTPNCSPPTYDA